MANKEDHALVADGEAPTEFTLMANTESKKDLSWTGLPEFVDDTVTDYSRPSPTIEIDRQAERPTTNKAETLKKPTVKYAEMYKRPSKKPTVRGYQRNWNKLKTQQLGPDFVMKKKACFNCGDFNHLAYDCRKRGHSYANRSFQRTSVVRPQYKAPWVPTVNRNFPPVNRKLPT
nr:ubiquitin hydrolase [Tanacetum cinerariifolium]